MVLLAPQQTLTAFPLTTSTWRQASPCLQQIGSSTPPARSAKPQLTELPGGQQAPSGVQISFSRQQTPAQPTTPGGQQIPAWVQTSPLSQQRPRQVTTPGWQQAMLSTQTSPFWQQSALSRHRI